jgi:hypothetical protein
VGPAARWRIDDGVALDAGAGLLVVGRDADVLLLAPGADPAVLDVIRTIEHPADCGRDARVSPAGDLLAVADPHAAAVRIYAVGR